jgi:hypothetical protein
MARIATMATICMLHLINIEKTKKRRSARPLPTNSLACVFCVLAKLEDRNTMMVFIGYEPGSKAWRFYNPATCRVHVSRDAVFEEDRA